MGVEDAGEILRAISRARRTASLFGPDHPIVGETLGEAHEVIAELLSSRQTLRFSIYEDAFYLESAILLEESLQLQPLLVDIRQRDIGTLELDAGLELAEVQALVEVLNAPASEIHSSGGAGTMLERQGVRHIRVTAEGPQRGSLHLKVDAREVYRSGLHVVDEITFQASRDVPLDLRKARLVLNSLMDILAQDKVALLGVSAIKSYDEDTAHHSVNVSILSLLLGSQFELSRTVMTTLGLSALLHDIGKVRIPREILTKAGKLTDEEMALMRRHTVLGAQMLRSLPGLARLAMVTALEHHANYDLSGYPEIAAKKVPHLLTRIIQLADFFDAATSSRRVYHRAMLLSEAMLFIVDRAGRLFDPVLARVFVRLLGLYPFGSCVELDTGDVGVVVKPGEREVTRPVVKVVRGRGRQPIPAYVVNLEEDRQRRIVRALDPLDLGIEIGSALLEDAPGLSPEELAGRGGGTRTPSTGFGDRPLTY